MAETAEGGVYRNASGVGYHDANGKPVEAGKVSEAKEMQRKESQTKMATLTPIPSQSSEALAAAMRSLLVPQQPTSAPNTNNAPETNADTGDLTPETNADTGDLTPETNADTGDLTPETERRARNRQG